MALSDVRVISNMTSHWVQEVSWKVMLDFNFKLGYCVSTLPNVCVGGKIATGGHWDRSGIPSDQGYATIKRRKAAVMHYIQANKCSAGGGGESE